MSTEQNDVPDTKSEEKKVIKAQYSQLDEVTLKEEKDKGEALISWLNANGSKFPHLYFEYLGIGYRGVKIDCDMQRDDIMLEISPECLLTIEVAKDSEIGRAIVSSGCRTRSTHSYVAAFMLQEREKTDSYWKPYIDIMPESYDHMPVFWNEEEMSMLQGSLCVEEIEYRKDSYETEYKNICRYVPEFARFSLSDFFWARLVVLTRIFGITINGKKTSSMVPMADMLNHKRPPETYWTFDNDLNAFTITASKSFVAGEVVYDSYGRKCNTEFLMNYGFVAVKNAFNESEMVLKMQDTDPLYQDKLRLLGRDRRKLQFTTDYDKDACMEAWSFCRVASATEAELDELTGGSRYYRPNTKRVKPINLRNEIEAIKLMVQYAKNKLAQFPTSFEEDEKLLENKELSRNLQNGIAVRMCEKEVLNHFVSFETELLPLLDSKRTAEEAEQMIRDNENIQSNKHFRAYANNVILAQLRRGTSADDNNLGDLIDRFAQMQVQPRSPGSPRFSDSDDF